MDRGANHRNVWLMCVSLVAVLVVASCGGGSESGSGESTLAEIDPGTTLAPGTSTTETESESEVTSEPGTTSEVPDPCSLLTVEEAARYDGSIVDANEPTVVVGATTRVADYGAFSVTVAPGGPAESLRWEGMEDDGTEAVDIDVSGANGAVAYLSDGSVWQVAAAGDSHSLLILLWTDPIAPDSPEFEQLRQLLGLAFGRL